MEKNTEWFSKVAASWNNRPGKIQQSIQFMTHLRTRVNFDKTMRVLDFGCGTGLNGINVINEVKTVGFLDPADGMREQTLKSLKDINCENYEIFDSVTSEAYLNAEPFDVIMSTMAFHHAENFEESIKGLAKKTKKGGKCFIVDLVKEDGSFHGEMKVPHNGFDTDELVKSFKEAGYADVKCEHYADFDQNGRLYPQFILIATM